MHGVQLEAAHRFTHMVSQIQWCHHAERSTVVGRIGLIMRNINIRCAILHLTSQNSTSCFTSRDGVLGFASCNLQYAFNSYQCTISADLKSRCDPRICFGQKDRAFFWKVDFDGIWVGLECFTLHKYDQPWDDEFIILQFESTRFSRGSTQAFLRWALHQQQFAPEKWPGLKQESN